MKEARPSQTAIGTAIMRAAHLTLDGEPKILEDHLALALSGAPADNRFGENLEFLQRPEVRQVRAYMVLRHRYVEDELARAVTDGVTQYVILGAGLDSFAYRRPSHLRHVRVFEIDHPASQGWKRSRLDSLGISVPDNVKFVAVDFEGERWTEKLEVSSFSDREPTFFSCLGVSQYISQKALETTLREITGSTLELRQVILDFVVPEVGLAPADRRQLAVMRARAEQRGEPWLSYYEPTHMGALLHALGFKDVEHFSPERACERYFRGRADGLLPPGTYHLVKASWYRR